VRKGDFIKIGGKDCCPKCPEVKDQAMDNFRKLNLLAGGIGRQIPAG